jgi:7,8-dihydroneopterin aldolase/epimerase/oxygenase
VRVELRGLEVFAYHGVLEQEQAEGQRFLIDVRFVPLSSRSAATDEITDAVDYRDVVAVVEEIAGGRRFSLLEALVTSLVDALVERLPVSWAEVTVRKPDVRLALPVEHAAVSAERYAATESE